MQPNPATAPSGPGDDGNNRPFGRGSDYDRYYRALDLVPGASLREIEDRLRLLRDAFDTDALPAELKSQAVERSNHIEQAAAELRRHWQTHAAPPPTADLSGAEGLLDALVEALAGSAIGTQAAPAARTAAFAGVKPSRARPQPAAAPIAPQRSTASRGAPDPAASADPGRTAAASHPGAARPAGRLPADSNPGAAASEAPALSVRVTGPAVRQIGPAAQSEGDSARPTPGVPWHAVAPQQPAPYQGAPGNPPVQRIEIALELVHRHVFVNSERGRALLGQTPSTWPYFDGRLLPGPPITVEPDPLEPPIATLGKRPSRLRHLSGAAMLKVGVAGLFIAIAVWLQQYHVDQSVPAAAGPDFAGSVTQQKPPLHPTAPESGRRSAGTFAQPEARGPSTENAAGASKR